MDEWSVVNENHLHLSNCSGPNRSFLSSAQAAKEKERDTGRSLCMSNPFAVETVRCAGPGCESVRRECNHWFVVFVDKGGTFVCYPYDKMALIDDRKPVCGSACAQKLFEQFLSKK